MGSVLCVHHANAAARAPFVAPNMERSSTHATHTHTHTTARSPDTPILTNVSSAHMRATPSRASQQTCRDLFWMYHPPAACLPAAVISIIWLARSRQHTLASGASVRYAPRCVVVRCRARGDLRRDRRGRGMHYNIGTFATRCVQHVRLAVESISETASWIATRVPNVRRASFVVRIFDWQFRFRRCTCDESVQFVFSLLVSVLRSTLFAVVKTMNACVSHCVFVSSAPTDAVVVVVVVDVRTKRHMRQGA